ncbi:MGMT family protein [Streptomyces sp. RB6PN25]|uniref:MGMT family protein n=1 Tax=Streptomyces humicola TaxID=2953240 RepID=A0ABT1Q5J4_9ACTN|nr:MGMT family protein [Streptomyces humicola]MCQ4085187.1 MGMT family protein [Streptomyces humicola]
MSPKDKGVEPTQSDLESALAGLLPPAPANFGLRVLRHVGISQQRYDAYVRLDTYAGGLYVAYSPTAVTGAALESAVARPSVFEEQHWSLTHRTAIRSDTPFPGLRQAMRTGRTRNVPVDLAPLGARQQAVLEAVRGIPKGQLRPIGWIAREAHVADDAEVITQALARNPVAVLVPCHRVTYDDGTPCDAGYPPSTGQALRAAEGIDMQRLEELSRRGAVFLGSDTTRIYCHPTCAHARRITPRHQQPFRSAYEARCAGYRACRSCRPVTV